MSDQLPPEWPLLPPDTAWPVAPKPPREVDEPELVEDALVPLRLATNPVETAVGTRRDQYERVLEE